MSRLGCCCIIVAAKLFHGLAIRKDKITPFVFYNFVLNMVLAYQFQPRDAAN